MLFRWYLKLAGVIAVGGLLTIVEALAQQPTVAAAGLMMSIQLSKTNTVPQPETSVALFLPNANQLTPLDKAYLDAFSILKEANICSVFYGGPAAIQVLNELKQQLKPTYLDSTVAVRMTGKTTKVISLQQSLSYRLFDKAELNLEGPFYRGNASYSGRSIGGFLPNTREARVTILLHELGHLIETRDKQWLLPNDGASEGLVKENTERVIAVCGEQIRRLTRISFAQQLQAARLTSPLPAIAPNVLVPGSTFPFD